MQLTQNWIKKQITDYSKMLADLSDEVNDAKLKTIWSERINTLQSVLHVIAIEMRTRK